MREDDLQQPTSSRNDMGREEERAKNLKYRTTAIGVVLLAGDFHCRRHALRGDNRDIRLNGRNRPK